MESVEYRWDRRRRRLKSRRDYQGRADLHAFQVILLIIIFFLWAIGAHIIFVYVAVREYYEEAFIHDMFWSFIYVCGWLFLFWCAVTAAYNRPLSRHFGTRVLHLILYVSIILLALIFHMAII